MLLLTSTSDKIQVVTGQAVTVDVHASWVDNASGVITPGRTNTAITTATTSDVVPSPASSTQRNLQTLLVRNTHPSSSVDVTVQHTDGTTVAKIWKITLIAGYTLQYLDGVGFQVLTSGGVLLSAGATGAVGPLGPRGYIGVMGPEGPEGDQGPVIPGRRGIQGIQGITGQIGAAGTPGGPRGPMGYRGLDGEDGEDGEAFHGVLSRSVTRGDLAYDAKNWKFLGRGTASAAIRTSLVSWVGEYEQLWFEYFISGYSNTAIGRLIVGPSSGLSETGTTFCTSLIEGVTITTTSVSVPGWPTAVTVNNVARYGHMYVQNTAGVVKRMTGHGLHAGTAPTTVPTQMRFAGLFNDTTNLIKQAELAVYDAITGAAISSRTFNAGTFLNVWGRNGD